MRFIGTQKERDALNHALACREAVLARRVQTHAADGNASAAFKQEQELKLVARMRAELKLDGENCVVV